MSSPQWQCLAGVLASVSLVVCQKLVHSLTPRYLLIPPLRLLIFTFCETYCFWPPSAYLPFLPWCSVFPGNRLLGILFHPFVQGWLQTWHLFNALLLEFTSETVNSPSPGWGPAGLGGRSPTLECLRSGAGCGELSHVRGLGRRRSVSGSPVLLMVLDDQWIQVFLEIIKKHNRDGKVIFDAHWGL